MAKPTFLLNQQNQKVPTLVAADGSVLYQLGIGAKANTYDDDSGWLGVATHMGGAAGSVNDGVVAVAGMDPTGTDTVRPLLVDGIGQAMVDVAERRLRISQTPTISNGAVYAAKDVIGGLLTFANAARAGILSGVIEAVTIVDKGQQMAAIDLVLFNATLTPAADNAIFAPSDSDLVTSVGVIPIATTDWKDFSTNSLATVKPDHKYVIAGTSLFGVLVSRGTPTYTSTTDLVVSIVVNTD